MLLIEQCDLVYCPDSRWILVGVPMTGWSTDDMSECEGKLVSIERTELGG